MNTTPDPAGALLARQEFEVAELFARHPPVIGHAGKAVVFEAARAGRAPAGRLVVSRFGRIAAPAAIPSGAPVVTVVEDIYRYASAPAGTAAWHVNFADPELFFAYGSAAFAQDEIQVAEHPALGALREALLSGEHGRLLPRTMDGDAPTPVLVQGVPRWCAIDLDPPLAFPHGVYGRRFHRARPEVLRQAVAVLDPPTLSNVIAMAAPPGGVGAYTQREIDSILGTAFTGFRAARAESEGERIAVHTGHWGTGAFGGDRVLMALLQLVAARLAGIDELVYCTVDAPGAEPVREALRHADRLAPAGAGVGALIEAVAGLGIRWGSSDGN